MHIYYNLEKKDGKTAVILASKEHYDKTGALEDDPEADKIQNLAEAAGAGMLQPGVFVPHAGTALRSVIESVRAAGNVVTANTGMHI